MREQWARRIALLTGLLVLLFAITFAVIQNPPIESEHTNSEITEVEKKTTPAELVEPIHLDAKRVEAGRQIYKQQGCARCHSINGEGNPRYPLDNVGIKHSAEALHDWITGADTLQTLIPERVFKLKQTYRTLLNEDLEDLTIYLQSLRPPITKK
jgi:cytochrome c553